MEAAAETGSGSKPIKWMLACGLGLPLFYFLSTGPVALVMSKYPDLESGSFGTLVRVIYFPVIWLEINTHFYKILDPYLNLWGAS